MFVFRGPKALGPSVVLTLAVFAFSTLGVAANLARAVPIVMAGVFAFRTENIVWFGVVLLLILRLLVAVAAVASTATATATSVAISTAAVPGVLVLGAAGVLCSKGRAGRAILRR